MIDEEELIDKKSKIPYIFFAFFAVVLVVNISYIYISKVSWTGIATKDSYQKGLQYNEALKQEKKQKELGWSVTTKLFNSKGHKVEIIVKLLDKKYRQITDADIYIEFKRPTQGNYDFIVKVEPVDGLYVTKVNFPMQGQWDFALKAIKGEDKFQEVKRYVIEW